MLPCPSAELVVVRLQQGLGSVPLNAAGQLLTGALLFWLTAAATTTAAATREVGIALQEGEARGASVLIDPAQPGLL